MIKHILSLESVIRSYFTLSVVASWTDLYFVVATKYSNHTTKWTIPYHPPNYISVSQITL